MTKEVRKLKFETKVIRKVAEFYYDRMREHGLDRKGAIAMALDAYNVVYAAEHATREEVKAKEYK